MIETASQSVRWAISRPVKDPCHHARISEAQYGCSRAAGFRRRQPVLGERPGQTNRIARELRDAGVVVLDRDDGVQTKPLGQREGAADLV